LGLSAISHGLKYLWPDEDKRNEFPPLRKMADLLDVAGLFLRLGATASVVRWRTSH